MSIIIFIIILSVLVFVHELGHFLVAKKAGVEVEEFGFGYPPRALTLGYRWGTRFSLNWIPFGGFVKILGENSEEGDSTSPPTPLLTKEKGARFTQVSKGWQAAILAAGVTCNIIFAWILLSLGFMIGIPTPVENDLNLPVTNPSLTIISVLPDSAGQKAGLKSGDVILGFKGSEKTYSAPEEFINTVQTSQGPLTLSVDRGGEVKEVSVEPTETEGKKLIGLHLDMVGTLKLGVFGSLWQGLRATVELTVATFVGIVDLFKNLFIGEADISQVSGPIGIVGLVGDATKLGIAYLLTFTALISINLAIINLLPFPALDGGRLLFVAIEAITRKKIPSRVVLSLNTVGFFLLIGLMLVVTIHDITNLF